MKSIVGSIEAEYRRYKALGEGAIAQLQEAELSVPGKDLLGLLLKRLRKILIRRARKNH